MGKPTGKSRRNKPKTKFFWVNVCASDYFSPTRGYFPPSNNNKYNTQPLISLEKNEVCFSTAIGKSLNEISL
jgi:hypothetical protein